MAPLCLLFSLFVLLSSWFWKAERALLNIFGRLFEKVGVLLEIKLFIYCDDECFFIVRWRCGRARVTAQIVCDSHLGAGDVFSSEIVREQ